jgi:hypothetical protein
MELVSRPGSLSDDRVTPFEERLEFGSGDISGHLVVLDEILEIFADETGQ